MGRQAKPPRLELRGQSWYIVDQGQKIACNTRERAEAETALLQYVAGKAAAMKRRKEQPPEDPSAVVIDHILSAYEADRLVELQKKKNKSVYRDTRIRHLKAGVDEAQAHLLAEQAAALAEQDVKDIGNDKFVLKHLRSFFGQFRPDSVTRELVEVYAEKRRATGVSRRSTGEVVRRVADGTIERELVVLRAALRWAAKADAARWMNGKAAPEFTMPVSGATARVRWLTKAEAAKLLATCHLPHVRLLIRIALATGARKAAIEELRWEQIDWERNIIDFGTVDPDNRKKRPLIQMTPELRRELWNARQVACSDYVIEFRGRRAGNTKKSIAAVIKKAGLKSIDPDDDVVGHILKHTFVSWMLQSGKSHEQIALIVNTTAATLQRTYAHVDLTAAADVADAVALDEHLRPVDWHPTEVAPATVD